jgi:probable rRNA maturation factor
VLSFPAKDAGGSQDMPRPVGDIAISFQTVAAEAARDGKTVADHTRHMIVHGILHLLGHDHEIEAEAEAMETLETEILAGFGVRDPYIMWN